MLEAVNAWPARLADSPERERTGPAPEREGAESAANGYTASRQEMERLNVTQYGLNISDEGQT